MRSTLGARTKLSLGALAAIGVIVTHLLAFLFVEPDPHARHALLVATGHGFWPYVFAFALGIFVAGVAGLVVRQWTGSGPGLRGYALYRSVAPRLIVIQGAGFLVLEGLERLVAGAGLLGLLQEPVVVTGLLVQVLVALAGALLVVLLTRAVTFLATLVRRRRADDPSDGRPPATVPSRPRPRVATGGATLRGPPLPARA